MSSSPATCARITAVLRRVEQLEPTATGALLVGEIDRAAGMVLIERNRVCWTAAAGMGRRLRDILRQHSSLALEDIHIEALYTRCRVERLPLGETLVRQGFVTAAQLRDALKQHTVESLMALDAMHEPAEDWTVHWVERKDRGYDPAYTFSAVEVATAVGAALVDPVTAEIVAEHLQDLDDTGCHAVAFVRGADGEPVFLGMTPRCQLSVDGLRELAGWSTAALEASGGFSPLVAHASVRSARAGGAVAWRMNGHICAAVCPTNESLVRLANLIGNQELPIALSTNLHVQPRP